MKYQALLFICLAPLFLQAQDAGDFLKKAIPANGRWEQINTIHYRANRYNFNPWQSYLFSQPGTQKDFYEFYLDRKTGRFHDHTTRHYPGGYVFDFIAIGRDSGYYEYDVTGSRTGRSLLKQGSGSYADSYKALLSYFPYYVLVEFRESSDSLQLKSINNEVVIYRHSKPGLQEIWLNKKTGLLRKYVITEAGHTSTWYYDDYTTIDGCLVPGKIKQAAGNSQVLSDYLAAFHINKVINPSLFELPAAYKEDSITAGPLVAKEIREGIFLVEKVDDDRNILFIDMGDYIVLTEAPVSDQTTSAILKLVHATIPGKPVKYVHLSHFHRDHIGGIRRLLEEGVTIICTRSLEKPVQELAKGITPSFLFFKGKKTLLNRSRRIDFLEVPNSHVQGLSFLYLPVESIIYEADLLAVPADGTITPAIQVYKEFYDFLKKKKVSYKQIFAHHGLPVITPAMFYKIRYL